MANCKAPARYHHGDLRNTLLQAAEVLLAEKGVAGLSLREVAKRSGVSHAAPYRHFRDKDALLRALAQHGFVQLAGAMMEAKAVSRHDPEHMLIEAGVIYVRMAVAHPELMQLMYGGVLGPGEDTDSDDASGAAFEGLVAIIRAGIEAGVFRARDAQELALTAWSTVHGLAMLTMAGLLSDDLSVDMSVLEAQVRAVARNVVHGMAI